MPSLIMTEAMIDGRVLEIGEHAQAAARGTIVLLHEALGSVSHWRDFPVQLGEATECSVIAYSRVGHGKSEGEPQRRSYAFLERQADHVLYLLVKQLQIERPILFGHSEGAALAALFAAAHPELPLAIVLEAPIFVPEETTFDGMRNAIRVYESTDLKEKLGRHHRDPDAVFRAWAEPWSGNEMGTYNLEARLRSIKCPVLVIQGDRDEFATVKQADILREYVRDAHIDIIPECGHTPHREKPAVVLGLVLNFLNQILSNGTSN